MEYRGGRRAGAGKTRIALIVQYDGTLFNGWQVQNSGTTIQGEIERALGVFLREECRTVAAGRTDAGVHALGQVVHFDCSGEVDLRRLCIGLNGILDKNISVKNAFAVPAGFNARFDAVSREYLYLIYNAPLRSPFMRYRSMWVPGILDIEYLREASRHLIGEMDFSSFCKKKSAEQNTVRRIQEFEISRSDEMVALRIKGNAFLHNMIRIITGTLLEMYRENRDPDYILEIIKGTDRDLGGFTAPAYGLYLKKVEYSPPLTAFRAAF